MGAASAMFAGFLLLDIVSKKEFSLVCGYQLRKQCKSAAQAFSKTEKNLLTKTMIEFDS
jgi:hypothetical protein